MWSQNNDILNAGKLDSLATIVVTGLNYPDEQVQIYVALH